MALQLSTGLRDEIMDGFATTFEDGIIDVFAGTKPATANLTEAGFTRLVRIVLDGGSTINSGTLTIGEMYQITDAGTSADFTNVGAPDNTLYTVFKATGTTPTAWGSPAATLKAGVGVAFGAAASGTIGKPPEVTWKGIAENNGTATWFRFYASDITTGASTEAIRFDGSVGTSSGEMRMVSTTIATGSSQTVDSFEITFPAS